MTIKELLKTAPVTTLLLVSFIGLFVLQVLTGVDANNPSMEALLKWGANALPLTMNNEPWRLISSGFLHIGLMHLLFNGFAMYFFGQIAEPMFGSAKFLALFLLAVIGGNLLNSQMKWFLVLDKNIDMNLPRIIEMLGVSAGASGGIMGIGAALLIAALFKISVNGMVLNLRSLMFIMGINLVYGFAVPGIDNAGHIGGAMTGLIIALAFALAYHQRQANALKSAHKQVGNNYQTTYIDSLANSASHISDNTARFDNNVNADNNISVNHDSAVNLALNSDVHRASPNEIKTAPKSELIWQLLPWLVILLISMGFVWWWQDIHQQLQALAIIGQSTTFIY